MIDGHVGHYVDALFAKAGSNVDLRQRIIIGVAALSCVIPLSELSAQTQRPDSLSAASTSATRASFSSLFPAAAAGSAAGLLAGAYLGSRTAWGDGDDPGLTGAIVFGAIGSAAGTAVALHLASNDTLSGGSAWSASVIGILGGVVGAAVGGGLSGSGVGVVVGYSIGHGSAAAALTRLYDVK